MRQGILPNKPWLQTFLSFLFECQVVIISIVSSSSNGSTRLRTTARFQNISKGSGKPAIHYLKSCTTHFGHVISFLFFTGSLFYQLCDLSTICFGHAISIFFHTGSVFFHTDSVFFHLCDITTTLFGHWLFIGHAKHDLVFVYEVKTACWVQLK